MGSVISLFYPDENTQSNIALNEPPISLFTLNELAEYDISPSKKRQYKGQIKKIFLQFQTEYKNLYDKRKKENNELIESEIDNSNEIKDIRKNTSILIVIGSNINIQESEYFDGEYHRDADDLSTALLFRHLFSNSFGIPQEQIMITSTQNSNFTKINIDKQLIANPSKIFKKVIDTDLFSTESQVKDEFYFRFKNENEFMLNQDINLAQVNDLQFKFYMDEDIRNIVKPFNIKIIEKELTINNESNLLVFLLDHEHARGFNEISYQFIIERLLEIKCKHFYVFNDSNYSGSIIKLIKLSEEFEKIFPEIENATIESALFYFLSNLNKVYSSDEQVICDINDKIDLIDDYDVDSNIKKIIKAKLQEIDTPMLSRISEFILNLGDEFQSIGCVSQHFIEFAQKATIFTSSDFNQISLTLPGRRFTYSILKNWRIRIFGSIFSSIVIETLLDKDSLITLEKFRDSIYKKYSVYKDKYVEYIITQNKYIEGKTNNSKLPKEDEINNFFSPKSYEFTHFFSKTKIFPKLNKILLKRKYWNVDITEVNPNEYNDVHFSLFENTNDCIFQSFSVKQLANYDIPITEHDKYNQETINLLFNQFMHKYQTSFCQRAKTINEKMKEKMGKKDKQVKQDEKNIRENISILIIVGSSVNIQKSEYFDGEYQKDAEDLDTALLIRHLFRYAFGIRNEQILIVSTQKSDFRYIQNDQITLKTNINEKESNINYKCANEDEFLLYQHVNLAQVGSLQYKIYFDENLKNVVKPFDTNVIKEKLYTNNNSDLFVFFLDHGYAGGFDSMPYQLIINHLLEIQCKHFYVFNDSCYSGSMIKLIQISQSFAQIFPDIKDEMLETTLFYFLMDLNKKSQISLQSDIETKIKSPNIDSKLKEYLENKLVESSNITKIFEYLYDIDDSFRLIECVPRQFIQFAEKATIFVSSYFNKKSFTLPGRKYNISILKKPKIRIFGSIFSSIVIETLLDKDSLITLEKFRDSIYKKYSVYKDKYVEYIITQNKYIEGKTNNSKLPKEDEINNFFSPKSYEFTHFFSKTKIFPKLNKILLKRKYWNVDITEVNPNEYNDVHFCNFKIYQPRFSNYNSKYGPVEEYFYMDKFMKDFKDAVEDLFKEQDLQKEFIINTCPQSNEDIEKESCPLYGKFIGLIRKFIKSSNYGAIRLLKVPIAAYFNDNSEDIDRDAKIFADAFKKIVPYWDRIDLQ